MIAKKSIKANLERRRFAFFQIGLLVAGSLTLAAFEYTSANYHEEMAVIQFEDKTFGIEDVPDRIIEEPINKPQPNTTVMNLDTDTIIAVDEDPFNLIVSNNAKTNINLDPDLNFDPNAGINMGITPEDDIVYEFVTKDPKFVGGDVAMYDFIQKKVQFPEIPREMGLSGVAFVSFVVEKDGSISNVKTENEKGDGTHNDFLMEGKRVVRSMPNWIPGENMGKKVRVRYTIPIKFNNL